jgi:hypothetical protein
MHARCLCTAKTKEIKQCIPSLADGGCVRHDTPMASVQSMKRQQVQHARSSCGSGTMALHLAKSQATHVNWRKNGDGSTVLQRL